MAPLGAGWSYEAKLDGWRSLVFVVDGVVTVRSRNGHDVTAAVPELDGLGASLDYGVVVLDGELVCGQGRAAEFYALSARMAARHPGTVAAKRQVAPATFVAFDVLHLDEPLIGLAYEERRARLVELNLRGPAWSTVPVLEGPLEDLVAACEGVGLEGLVAKRRSAVYRPGERSRHWRKVKTASWRTEHGPRRHEPHGAHPVGR